MNSKLFIIVLFLVLGASAHEGHHHLVQSGASKTAALEQDQKAVFDEIGAEYRNSVQPIFLAKCADCHSVESESPWYSKIPLVHQLIENDRSEAKEHLEISKGFPFGGHGTPAEDLKAIKDAVEKNSMPTAFYSIMHPSSKLSAAEKESILKWVNFSNDKLNLHSRGKM